LAWLQSIAAENRLVGVFPAIPDISGYFRIGPEISGETVSTPMKMVRNRERPMKHKPCPPGGWEKTVITVAGYAE
jgi:hypothetical protein